MMHQRRRNKSLLLWGSGLVILAIAVFAAMQMGETSPVIASGTLELPPELEQPSKDLRTLFIIVHNPASQMPMPYGAFRVTLNEAPKGRFYHFNLTKENLRVMNPDAPPPAKIRLKARLDVDGGAGPDTPGDVVGSVDDIAFGAQNVSVVLNQVIP